MVSGVGFQYESSMHFHGHVWEIKLFVVRQKSKLIIRGKLELRET